MLFFMRTSYYGWCRSAPSIMGVGHCMSGLSRDSEIVVVEAETAAETVQALRYKQTPGTSRKLPVAQCSSYTTRPPRQSCAVLLSWDDTKMWCLMSSWLVISRSLLCKRIMWGSSSSYYRFLRHMASSYRDHWQQTTQWQIQHFVSQKERSSCINP